MSAIQHLVCGCPVDGHRDGCILAEAEQVALDARRDSVDDQVVAVVQELGERGLLLRRLDPDDVFALVDALYEFGILTDDPDAAAPPATPTGGAR